LRSPMKENIEAYMAWMNDLEVLQYIARSRPMGRAEEEEWFANLPKRVDDLVLEMALLESGEVIGSCGS
jgi:RimJ/RimL family protein N-acetyltransferase